MSQSAIRHDWQQSEIVALMEMPFNDLLYRAHLMHRENFDPNAIQLSSLMSIKSGGCSEDCAYCPQSAHFQTNVKAGEMAAVSEVAAAAAKAKEEGATRFCMGAAWRGPKDSDLDGLKAMVGAVKALGMEACLTLGMLSQKQAAELKQSGLDYYNHNIDTSPQFYDRIIKTHGFQDRLNTLNAARAAGLKICTGGIIGMGESLEDRASMLRSLAAMDPHPESAPINMLTPIAGTPLADALPLSPLEMVRMVASARIILPRSYVRLSAGRGMMSAEAQALCFFAGANSIFYGDRLLTTGNQSRQKDQELFAQLGINRSSAPEPC